MTNVVILVVDDLGFGDVGYNGGFPTPTIDRLADEGVTLTRFYTSPTCTASRAALLTGKYPLRLGLQDSIIHPSEPRGVPLVQMLPQKLEKHSVFIGKWHLGFCEKKYIPTRRGWDKFYGILTGGGDHYTHESTETFTVRQSKKTQVMTGSNLWEDERPAAAEGHTTELYTEKALEYLQENILLVVAYQAVHAPIQARGSGECSAMCAMVAGVDRSVARIERALRPTWNDTVLFFLSDNGGILRHGSSNGPLRGEKGSYFEGGIRVPAFVSGGLAPRRIFHGLVHITDIYATILGLHSIDNDGDGIDQWDAWHTGRNVRERIVHNINSESFGAAGALRVGDYKLIVEARVSESEIYEYGRSMLQDDAWDAHELSQVIRQKLLRAPTMSLFNIIEDPNESANLFDNPDFRRVQDAMLAEWAELRDSTPPSTEIWLDDGPLANPALFGGVWGPWRDDTGVPLATYKLADTSFHPNLNGRRLLATAPDTSFFTGLLCGLLLVMLFRRRI